MQSQAKKKVYSYRIKFRFQRLCIVLWTIFFWVYKFFQTYDFLRRDWLFFSQNKCVQKFHEFPRSLKKFLRYSAIFETHENDYLKIPISLIVKFTQMWENIDQICWIFWHKYNSNSCSTHWMSMHRQLFTTAQENIYKKKSDDANLVLHVNTTWKI